MKFCPQCGAQLDDAAVVCTNCGANLAAPQPQPMPQQQYYAPVAPMIPAYDHTAEYDAKEVSEGKVFAIAVYLLGTIGIIIALLGSHDNKYAAFHVRNGLRITIMSIIALIVMIVPFIGWLAYGVWSIITLVVKIICLFNVFGGKAVEAPIIRSFTFLK